MLKKLILPLLLLSVGISNAFGQPTDANNIAFANNLVLQSYSPAPGHNIKQEQIKYINNNQIVSERTLNYDRQGALSAADIWIQGSPDRKMISKITKNEQGQWVKQDYVNEDPLSKTVYQTDEQGRIVLGEISFGGSNDKSPIVAIYDNNRLVSLKMTTATTSNETLYRYNDRGDLVEKYSGQDDLIKISNIYGYNKQNRLITQTTETKLPDGSTLNSVQQFSNFDQQGNWQKAVVVDDPSKTVTRTIIYY